MSDWEGDDDERVEEEERKRLWREANLLPAGQKPDEPRMAICDYARANALDQLHGKYGYASTPVPSSPDLAFFQAKPDEKFDRYYDGCFGWD